jgi:NitT/TauT family transport system permease protein
LQRVGDARLVPSLQLPALLRMRSPPKRLLDAIWLMVVVGTLACVAWMLLRSVRHTLSWSDLAQASRSGSLTLLRVMILVALASAIWVPIGVLVGLRPRLTATIQPIAQFLAAFPANLLFPLAVFLIVRFDLAPAVWLSPLMILGTQWYILFNVIAGASAFPSDLREAAASLRIRSPRWWTQVILPGIFPYFVTGAITASGGAWNASIVSEAVNWGSTTLNGGGLGAYIAQMTQAGDYPRIALGVAVMSVYVVAMNRLLWRPLYAFAERRTRLD